LPNAWRPRVLEQGLDVKVVGISNRDAEFLNLRKYQVNDIARIFGVPPHMMQDLDRATFNNIEHLSLEFVTFCPAPSFERWVQALARDLMSAKMRSFYEFRPEKLIVSDVLQRFQAWNAPIISGWVNRNEIRERVKKTGERSVRCTRCQRPIVVERQTKDGIESEYVSKDGRCWNCAQGVLIPQRRKRGQA
jgi:HK97 family phage portal protein